MPYRVELRPRADKALSRLPTETQKRITERLIQLQENPRPPGVLKLAGEADLYRIRVGEYRVIYRIHDDILYVLVVAIGHRREIYRDK